MQIKKKQFYSFKYIFRYRKQWCFIARARSAQLPLCVYAAVIFRRKEPAETNKNVWHKNLCKKSVDGHYTFNPT